MYSLEFMSRAFKNMQDIVKKYRDELPYIEKWFEDL